MKKAVIGLSAAAMLTATSCALNEQTNELETTWLFWAILAFFIVAAIVGCIQNVKNEEEKKERAEKLKKVTKKFHVSAKVVGVNNRYQFIVDDVDKRIILVEATGYKKNRIFRQDYECRNGRRQHHDFLPVYWPHYWRCSDWRPCCRKGRDDSRRPFRRYKANETSFQGRGNYQNARL